MNDSTHDDLRSPSPLTTILNGITTESDSHENSIQNAPQPSTTVISTTSSSIATPPKPRIYCLNTKQHPPSRPSASQDLVALYSLTPLANAVARFDPVTGKKNTMRKSYQGHIKDLPGRNIVKPDNIIREMLRVPDSEADTFVGPRNIRRLDRETLEGFAVLPGTIPDFDASLLGLDDDLSDQYDHGHRDGDDEDYARRKKKRRNGDTDLDDASGAEDRKKKRKKTREDDQGYLSGYRDGV